MPAGDYPAGDGPAGYDPPQSLGQRRNVTTPPARFIDLATRDGLLDSAGFWRSLHPVDQAARLTFLVPRGRLKSAPDLGHAVLEIKNLSGEQLTQAVRQRVLSAEPFARLIANGDVEHVETTVDERSSGGFVFSVKYRNLRTGEIGSVDIG